MTAPMDADVQLRASLDELLVVAAGAQRTATVDPVFAYEHAWFARTIDTIRAALVLHDNGFGEVAAPLIRTGLEHAVGLRWLLTVGEDGIETLAKAHQKWAQDVLKSKSAADQNESAHGRKDWSPEMTRALEEVIARAVPSNPTNRDANHLQRFETAGAFDLYVAWLSETGYSHATQASARPYVVDGDRRYLLLAQPQRAPDSVVIRASVVAVVAVTSMAEALGSDLWSAKISQLSGALVDAMVQAEEAGSFAAPSTEDWSRRFDLKR